MEPSKYTALRVAAFGACHPQSVYLSASLRAVADRTTGVGLEKTRDRGYELFRPMLP
jgi:hypothetical protein